MTSTSTPERSLSVSTPERSLSVSDSLTRPLLAGACVLPITVLVSSQGERSLAAAIVHLLIASAALCSSVTMVDAFASRLGLASRRVLYPAVIVSALALVPVPFSWLALLGGFALCASPLSRREEHALPLAVVANIPFVLAFLYQFFLTR